MNNVAGMSGAQRRELFIATADRMGITAAAAEKDFWIVWVLFRLFSMPAWNNRLRFKGGTSLSKAYGLIERFSEDIDLILDWRGLTDQSPKAERSKTKQAQLNAAINIQAQELICKVLLPDLRVQVQPVCKATIDKQDAHTINIQYPAEFSAGYLRPVIRLEIGPLAAMLPMETRKITSYAAEHFPEVFDVQSVAVATISAERTFWEKATILHAEFHRSNEKALPSRYARHYYDLSRMAGTTWEDKALSDLGLLEQVVRFKKKFYPMGWASYESATPDSIRLLPAPIHTKALQSDYHAMKEMIFGEIPSFDGLLQTLFALEERIRRAGR